MSLDITPTEAVLERIGERDHFGAIASLRAVLPQHRSPWWAAAMPGNVGSAVLANIIAGGFEGVVTPVNRTGGGLVSSMQAASSLSGLEVAPELVIIAVAGDEVLGYAAEAAANGARVARSPRWS